MKTLSQLVLSKKLSFQNILKIESLSDQELIDHGFGDLPFLNDIQKTTSPTIGLNIFIILRSIISANQGNTFKINNHYISDYEGICSLSIFNTEKFVNNLIKFIEKINKAEELYRYQTHYADAFVLSGFLDENLQKKLNDFFITHAINNKDLSYYDIGDNYSNPIEMLIGPQISLQDDAIALKSIYSIKTLRLILSKIDLFENWFPQSNYKQSYKLNELLILTLEKEDFHTFIDSGVVQKYD